MSEIAFVAGATGYVGREVVRALRARDIQTVAHIRPDSSRREEWRARFRALGANPDTTAWTEEEMSARLRALAPTRVFALIGTTRKRARAEAISGDRYETIDYGLTATLLRSATTCSSAPRFVYLSSEGVSSRTRSAYLKVRWRFEQELISSGLPYSIARPSFITGPDRDDGRPGERAAAAVADSLLAVAGALGARRLRSRYRSTSGQTLGEALVRIALGPGAEDRILSGDDLR